MKFHALFTTASSRARPLALALLAVALATPLVLSWAAPTATAVQRPNGPPATVTAAPHLPLPDIQANTGTDSVQRGAYLARAGDCVACHTAPGGKPFAGGLPMATPIGTLFTSNITPDPKTGIGGYSFEDFDQAVRHGYAKGKGSLLPAMPYPSYARVSEQDMRDLYAYFTKGVQPVEQEPPANTIAWPLSMRWPLGIWRRVFAPDPVEVQASAEAAAPTAQGVLRGAYLVEGLGHCGTCHTPRSSLTMQEKALTASDPLFLAGGGVLEGWQAKNLRGDQDGLGRWSEQDIVDLLKTGRNRDTAVFGGMADVVQHSTQYLSASDLQSIAVYLKTLPAAQSTATVWRDDPSTADALWKGDDRAPGSALFLDNCAACHRSDGKGYGEVFPALAGNSAVLTQDPHNLVAMILHGGRTPATGSRPSGIAMPSFGWRLSNDQVADLANFVRSGWGNAAPAVTASQVHKIRESTVEAHADARAQALPQKKP
ncbi:cytochrome c [Xylophilus sp. GOD-11R]|uniref:cytochrome c n=1 Tax=Xylophilus sp. GOD-11R TaxID=3089814 RepID=UPI00298CC4F2|nr:cytochrome c [Xylophilus sp. GOD-11R]WPB55817.1 cytochrome c [Xylophilus sp. GOD-11R]